jgi:hypothetical protein
MAALMLYFGVRVGRPVLPGKPRSGHTGRPMIGTPLGADELGALLKHTPDWVRASCRAGRLPHHKIGKLYVFTAEDVAEHSRRDRGRGASGTGPAAARGFTQNTHFLQARW